VKCIFKASMWANMMAACESRWRPLFNAAVWLTPSTRVPCSNDAKTRKPLKFDGCPKLTKRSQPLVGRSSLYCADMWSRYCYLTCFLPIVDTRLSCKDSARQSCAIVRRWQLVASFLRRVFPASRVQHISDLHSKFALRPHHVYKYGRHPLCDR